METTQTTIATSDVTVLPPSGTDVPSGSWEFVETAYEPHTNVTTEQVAKLNDNDLLTGLKKQRKRTQEELDAFVVFFEGTVQRFGQEQPRDAVGQFQRGVKPALPEAFKAIGLNYETERKRKQRYIAARNTRVRLLPSPPSIREWRIVKDTNAAEYVVVAKSRPGEVEVVPTGGELDDATTVATTLLTQVPVKKLEPNDLLLCADNGKQYRYIGKGTFKCVEMANLIKQKQNRDAEALKAVREQMKATQQEKARVKELRSAEAARRDLDLITERPEKNKKRNQQSNAAQAKRPAEQKKPKTEAEVKAEANKKAKEKADKEAAVSTTNLIAAQRGYGVNGNGKSVFVGKPELDSCELLQ